MKRHVGISISLILSLVLSLLASGNVAATNVQRSGTVTDQSSTGIIGATVAVMSGGTTGASTSTGSGGHYALTFPSGTYTIQVTPPSGSNFTAITEPNQNLSADAVFNFTFIVVTPPPPTPVPAVLSGTFLDTHGAPLANQTLHLDPSPLLSNPGGPSSITDACGAFSLNTMTGSHVLILSGGITYPDGSMLSYGLQGTVVLSHDTTLALNLPVHTITVYVQDQVGAPIANTSVNGVWGGAAFDVQVGQLAMTVRTIGPFGVPETNSGYATTDTSGSATIRLLAGTADDPNGNASFVFYAHPPEGNYYPPTLSISNVAITSDITEFFVLQNGAMTGSTNGGTQVTIGVPNYQPGTRVLFDGVPATSITPLSTTANSRSTGRASAKPDLVAVVAPPHASAGKVDVVIVKPDGTRITYPNAFTYTVIAAVPGPRPGQGGPPLPSPPANPPPRLQPTIPGPTSVPLPTHR